MNASTPWWSGVGLLSVVGLAVVAVTLFVSRLRAGRKGLSQQALAELGKLPMTPLQKRAWWALIIGLGLTVAVAVLIADVGPVAYFDDDDLRIVVLLLEGGVLASFLFVIVPVGLHAATRGAKLDERDQRILSVAPHAQAVAVLITLVAWSIALTEIYRGEGGIPRGFMYLMASSVFLAYLLAHSAGILMGYWFARHDAEG